MTRIGDQALLKVAADGLTRDKVQEIILEFQKVAKIHTRIATENQTMAEKLEAVRKDKPEERPEEDQPAL
jgi:Asp-tRNA(Asn)/Glu-tRNA(Gln) amidotransferase C subunit